MIEDHHDRGVIERRDRLHLALEDPPIAAVRGRRSGQELDRHRQSGPSVHTGPHLCHSALAERLHDGKRAEVQHDISLPLL